MVFRRDFSAYLAMATADLHSWVEDLTWGGQLLGHGRAVCATIIADGFNGNGLYIHVCMFIYIIYIYNYIYLKWGVPANHPFV